MSSLEADKWILVGNLEKDPHTQTQINVIKEMDLQLKGAIMCNDEKHRDSDVCKTIPAFPSFCNIETQVCVAGLRENNEQFASLQAISNEKREER